MSDFQNPLTLYVAGILANLIFLGSLYLWIRRWPNRESIRQVPDLQPWSESWLDLGIVIWFAFVVLVALSLGGRQIVLSNPDLQLNSGPNHEVTWLAILLGMSIQLAFVITLFGAKYYYRIRYFTPTRLFPSSTRPVLAGAEMLIRYMPVLWIVAFVSSWLLKKYDFSSGQQETITMMTSMANPWKYLVCVFVAVVLAPVLEELFFRGIVFRFLQGKMSTMLALVISSALFAMLHFNLDSLLPIFVLGCLLGSVYRRTGDIRASIWMHVFFNGFSIFLISVDKWLPTSF